MIPPWLPESIEGIPFFLEPIHATLIFLLTSPLFYIIIDITDEVATFFTCAFVTILPKRADALFLRPKPRMGFGPAPPGKQAFYMITQSDGRSYTEKGNL